MDFDPQPPKKRKKGKKGCDELDDLLIRNLNEIEERRYEEELYARQVAATLRRQSDNKLLPNYAFKVYF